MSRASEASKWLSVGDLMAGVVGVLVLMLVMAALQQQVERAEQKKREDEAETARLELEQKRVGAVFDRMVLRVEELDLQGVIEVDAKLRKIRLKEGTFPSGSACLNRRVGGVLSEYSGEFRTILEEPDHEEWVLMVEGHSDSVPVLRPGTDKAALCALYDDNYTLSSARAREARAVIVAGWPEVIQERVALAGFGPSRPLDATDTEAAVNRRVEITFWSP
jgi:chemotaxis protein MotB